MCFKTFPLLISALSISCFNADLSAQTEMKLSNKHIQKVNKQNSPSEKLALYRKYYYKDSIKHLRETEKYWQAKTDSLSTAIEKREKAIERRRRSIKDGIDSKVYRTVYTPWAKKQAREEIKWLDAHKIKLSPNARQILLYYFEQYFLSATQNDSILVALKSQLPSLPIPQKLSAKTRDFELINPLKADRIKARAYGNIPEIKSANKIKSLQGKISNYARYEALLDDADSLKDFLRREGEKQALTHISKTAEFRGVSELKKQNDEVDKIKSLRHGYQTEAKNLQDSIYRKEQTKKKAEEMAMKYIGENPQLVKGVQKKMNRLMKKYSMVPNSNDLSTAIKRSSLKGKSIRQRLVIGGNFQVLSWSPFTLDFSPSLGYKFNRNFVVGIGGNYRQTFSTDTFPNIAPNVLGWKAFVSHDIARNFFVYGEFDRNSPGLKIIDDNSVRVWRSAAFAGVGRKIVIHSKIEMTVIAMYNFMHKSNDPIYPRPFVVRIGFQTSELALRKK